MKCGLSLLTALLFSACIIREDSSERAGLPNWKRLSISGVGSIYAAAGDFSTRFYIATAGRVWVTTDEGENWSTSLQLTTSSPPLGFAKHGDSLILKTVVQDYITEDEGLVWKRSEPTDFEVENQQYTITSRGDFLEFKPPAIKVHDHHNDDDDGGGHSPLAQPAELNLNRADATDAVNIFPYNVYAYSVYLDEEDRVFVCTNDWEWDSAMESFSARNSKGDGVIYIGSLYP